MLGPWEVKVRTCGEPPGPGAVYLCPSVGEYPIYNDNIYQVMLEDERRNTLFRSAIKAAAGMPFDLRLYVGGVDATALMSTTGVMEDLRFNESSYVQGGDLRLGITRCGRVDGLLAWIELAVAPGDAVLNSLAEDTNWLPVYVPFALGEPIEVSVGDVLSLQVAAANADDGIHPEYSFRGQLTRTGSGVDVTVSAESRYSGGAFRSTVVHRRLLR
jgi:protein arginine N-methyltransferase 1